VIWAVVLAAGESLRMGTPKMLLPFGDETIIETVVGTLVRSRVDRVLVVLGSGRDKIAPLLAGKDVKTVVNRRYREGMLSSVQEGFQTIPHEAEAALVCLGDQPLIPVSVIDLMIGCYKKSGKGIILPVYDKKRGHPILIDSKYKDEVLALDPAIGLRALTRRHPQDVQEVEVDTAYILKDIDYPEDYRRDLKIKEEN
jgi:molybdenum cofactor cytidylyltransferase